MNKFILLLLLLLPMATKAQAKFSFLELGSSEVLWVVCHPFVAVKAKRISAISIRLSDSIARVDSFPNLQSGGEKDALRHGLWMALLAQHIGSKKALKLGEAHERKNWKEFKRNRIEEGFIPDFIAGEMDAFNNYRASEIAGTCRIPCEEVDLVNLILQALYQGMFRIVKMDLQGNSLDQEDRIIAKSKWEGKWLNNRQLVPSNYLLNP